VCLELPLPTETFHFLSQFHFVNVIYGVVLKNAKYAYKVGVIAAAISQVRSMFLEKWLVIEPTTQQQDTNLELRINLFQEIQLARNDTLYVFETRKVSLCYVNTTEKLLSQCY